MKLFLFGILLLVAACNQAVTQVCPGYEQVNADQCRDSATGKYVENEKCTSC